jgi:hypothetical protein
MASKARKKKIAERIYQLESMRSNPELRETAEQEIEDICLRNKLSLEELFEIDEMVLSKIEKNKLT